MACSLFINRMHFFRCTCSSVHIILACRMLCVPNLHDLSSCAFSTPLHEIPLHRTTRGARRCTNYVGFLADVSSSHLEYYSLCKCLPDQRILQRFYSMLKENSLNAVIERSIFVVPTGPYHTHMIHMHSDRYYELCIILVGANTYVAEDSQVCCSCRAACGRELHARLQCVHVCVRPNRLR